MSKPGKTLKSDEFAPPSSFCWNEKCADYGRRGAGNLREFGFTRKGRQRWQCTSCQKVVAETKGTDFHGKQYDEQTIIECCAMLAERNSLAAIHRIKGIKEETVSAWLVEVAPQLEQIEQILFRDHKMSRTQLDALWA
jgi:transposase-like protein